jgi:serine/threonine-protein kinase
MALSPGTRVGNLRLAQLLGKGGMGSVWIADHLTLQTQVAVKFMAPEIAEHPQGMARFAREAAAAAQIKSPHVVQVFDHGFAEDGTPYIVMELLDGEDLSQRLDRDVTLPVEAMVTIVDQICKALSRAHALGIIHRDIKPDNVFLVRSEDDEVYVKLLDFGIAKSTDDDLGTTTPGSIIGTPYYMSPEQLIGAGVIGPATDLWSVAVVGYHALTGFLPFDADTVGGLCIAINEAKFQPATAYRPDLPPSVNDWFARALARDPAQRFISARELAGTFAAALGVDTGARRSSTSGSSTPVLIDVTDSVRELPTLLEGTISSEAGPKRRSWFLPALGLSAAAAVFGVLAWRATPPGAGAPAAPPTRAAETAQRAPAVSPQPTTVHTAARTHAPSVPASASLAPAAAASTKPRRPPPIKSVPRPLAPAASVSSPPDQAADPPPRKIRDRGF